MASRNPRRIEYVDIDEIEAAPRNPKGHSAEMIDGSFTEHGFTEAALLDERTGRLVAGHGRLAGLRARRAADGEPPEGIVVRRDGRWLMPVQRGWASRDDAQAEAYLLMSNRATEAGGWDQVGLADVLTDLVSSDVPLEASGFTDTDLSQLLDELARNTPDDRPDDVDDAPVPPVAPVTGLGDVWELGGHRLVCGDSTDAATYDVLLDGALADMVWTDPPYGVDYVGKTADALTIQNDGAADLLALLTASLGATRGATRPGAVWEVAAPAGPQLHAFATVLTDLGVWRQSLVWVKDRFVLGHSDYHYRHEFIFYGWTPGAPHRPPPSRTFDTVLDVPRPARSEDHPTMKPVALIERALLNHTDRLDLVLDPFGGSGSTLIACEVTGRRCATIELDPRYCDVIARRWQQQSGQVPVRNGEPCDMLASAD